MTYRSERAASCVTPLNSRTSGVMLRITPEHRNRSFYFTGIMNGSLPEFQTHL
jgi:hypothetical protein